MNNLMTLAYAAFGYFQTVHTERGSILKVKPDAPIWMSDLVHHAHGDMLPDDRRYQYIREACDLLSENEDLDDAMNDVQVDVYTPALIDWLGSHSERRYYADMALHDYGIAPDTTVVDIIDWGQRLERCEVIGLVDGYLRDLLREHDINPDDEGLTEAQIEAALNE